MEAWPHQAFTWTNVTYHQRGAVTFDQTSANVESQKDTFKNQVSKWRPISSSINVLKQ